MSGPVIKNPTPAWMRPENASVLDTPLEKAIKWLAGIIGADDPNGQVLSMAAPMEVGREAVTKAIEALAQKAKAPIRAYHGSPHDFDQFSLSKIGTGEGAQAYGHGLYFADSEGVARDYRNRLTAQTLDAPGGEAYEHFAATKGNPVERVKAAKRSYLKSIGSDDDWFTPSEHQTRVLDAIEEFGHDAPGRMYEVNIHADPEDFLDWDKPLSQQSKKVQKALSEIDADMYATHGNDYDPNETGAQTFQRLRRMFGDSKASAVLEGKGVKGNVYLDGASRSAGQGSRNYVVFDDKLISIVKKYGIAGALSAGAINQMQARQLKEQGYQ